MLDVDRCYQAVQSRDARFDGWFVTAVRTTGIYCRPSCPALTPRRHNVEFHPTAAAAQQHGFRACKRCRPDATPGSPEWNLRDDLVGRAMRLIADGAIDLDGVSGLATRLGYSERQIRRILLDELGAGPVALARAQRAQTARLLIETTDLPMTDIAFAAGFGSVRQFNDTVREVFATAPSDLRRGSDTGRGNGSLTIRLAARRPFDGGSTLAFLGARAIPGLETWDGTTFARAMHLPRGAGIVRLSAAEDHVRCTLRLDDVADLQPAVRRCRQLLDLDADPVAVDGMLGADPLLAPLVRATPGRRSPGAVDGAELASRAVLGQQITIAAARTLAGRLVARYGEPLTRPHEGITHLFPTPAALSTLTAGDVAMPARRIATLAEVNRRLACGELIVDPSSDRREVRERLAGVPGIGPWTVGYVAMRALGDPDVFPQGDVVLRARLAGAVPATDPESWRPWRSYAAHHLWAAPTPKEHS